MIGNDNDSAGNGNNIVTLGNGNGNATIDPGDAVRAPCNKVDQLEEEVELLRQKILIKMHA